MKLRHPLLIRVVAVLAAGLIRVWMATIRYQPVFADRVHPIRPETTPLIYAFWHESILFATKMRVPAHVLISLHADGELITRAARLLGFQVVRGSTTRGGTAGLLEMARIGPESHLAFTPDGPRGPRRRVQPGVIQAASVTGRPIVGFGVAYRRGWRAKSWDRFAIPKPFTMAYGLTTPELRVPPHLDREGIEAYRRLLEEYLLEATEAAERWAAGGPKPAALRRREPVVRPLSA